MAVRSFDPEAEESFLSSLLNGVSFDDLISRVTPDMLYGQMHGEDWTPVARRFVYETILELYHRLKSVPSKNSVVAYISSNPVQIANVREDMVVSLIERIWNKGTPDNGVAIDARIRIYKAYTIRYAADLLEQGAKKLETGAGEETIKLLHEKSVIKASRTEDYTISNYKAEYFDRVEHVKAVQRGDDTSVQKILFGIRGLDIETGGMSAGEFIVGTLGPGRGKTITMQDSCAFNVEQNVGCTFFTKEMTNTEIGFRFDSRFTGIVHPKFHHCLIDDQDFKVWDMRMGQLQDHLRIVVMRRDFTPARMRDILQSLDWTFHTRMVYCDYLNIMHPTDERDRRKPSYEAGGILCEELKDLAIERSHPIMTMCQLKPQSIDKLRITYDDIALNKLAVSANANVVFAILADEWYKQMGKAILQILKIRQKQPDRDMWDMFPVLNNIRIDSNVHGLVGHPAPQIQQNFNTNMSAQVLDEKFGKKAPDKHIRIIGADGSPLVGN